MAKNTNPNEEHVTLTASDIQRVDLNNLLEQSRAIAAAPPTLPGLAPALPMLPADLSRARRLSEVSTETQVNITKDKLMEWGNLYLVGSRIVVTNQPKNGSAAYLFSFRTPEHPGVWSEFFGMENNQQREAMHAAITADPSTPIGPLWLEMTYTQSGNKFFRFTDMEPFRVQQVIPEDTEAF